MCATPQIYSIDQCLPTAKKVCINRSAYVPFPLVSKKKERRHCCLIYRLEGGVLCPSCPRLRAEHRKDTTYVKG
ncbi:(2Fe-2S)-binding protein [Candidatus Symbiopectobacterium sp. PLON1]|uniref:(2Fe-2S)-binding protein n=1 Tax=Candidatus Symbiopectobacterium sp. PLON1 TaxID=2794575 RepID=UPI001A2D2A85|nr:hypothetical protein [Candidatus Symbiopectobacterium sp. PLON1]